MWILGIKWLILVSTTNKAYRQIIVLYLESEIVQCNIKSHVGQRLNC